MLLNFLQNRIQYISNGKWEQSKRHCKYKHGNITVNMVNYPLEILVQNIHV